MVSVDNTLNGGSVLRLAEQPFGIQFYDYSMVHEGKNWIWDRNKYEEQWQEWYEGRFNSLFLQTATLENSLGILKSKEDVIILNLFKATSDFYASALIAESPSITSDSEAQQAWLDEKGRMVEMRWALRQAAMQWSVKDRFVLMADIVDGQPHIQAIDPSAYFPIVLPHNPNKVIGHLLAFVWFDYENAGEFQATEQRRPNRITFIKYSEGYPGYLEPINEGQVHRLDGFVVQEPIGEPYTPTITGVWQAGVGQSLYPTMAPIVRDIALKITQQSIILTKQASPHLIVPDTFEVETDRIWKDDGSYRGRTIGEPSEDKGITRYLEMDGSALQMFQPHIDRLFNMLQIASYVPPDVFGVDVGKGESAASRQQLMFVAQSRIREARQQIAVALTEACYAMGCPEEGNLTIQWAADPLENLEQKTLNTIQLVGAKIISPNEARQRLGMQPKEGEGNDDLGGRDATADQPGQNDGATGGNSGDPQRG